MSLYFKDLNGEQTDAVKADGNVLITACPGSGKTRVITHKLAFELEKIQGLKRMLVALTFTNRAADEIRRRIERMNIDTDKLWSGTIHAFCLEWIIKPYEGYLLDTANGFVIADDIESDEIIRALKEKYRIDKYDTINRIYKLDGTFDTKNEAHIALIKEYKSIIHSNRKIDFDDILYFSYKLITLFPVVAVRLSNLFELICVDEYQDTQELQYAILAQIVKAKGNKTRAFFVGDVSQAIYGSLGGVAKSVDEISRQFGNIRIETMKLTGNYRSTQRMVDYFSNFAVQPGKITAVSSIAGEIGAISFNKTVNKDRVDEAVATLIRFALDRKVRPEEICVMAPQWWMIYPMGRKLKSLLPDVDFDAFGLSPFRKVRDNTWFKVIRLFLTTPGNSSYAIRHQWAGEVLTVLDDYFPSFLQQVENRKRYLLRIVNHFKSHTTDSFDYMGECLHYFASELGLPVDTIPPLVEARRIFDDVVKKELEKDEFDYAREIHVLRRVFNSKSGVVVSTCHGVKGEEYDTVIAFGLLDGYIPNWGDPDQLASNKLLYVICSRAKCHLHLIAERGHKTKRGDRTPTPVLSGVKFRYDPPNFDAGG